MPLEFGVVQESFVAAFVSALEQLVPVNRIVLLQ